MKRIAVALVLLGLVLIGSTNALRKRTGTGDEPNPPMLEHLEIPDIDVANTTAAMVRWAASDPAGVKYILIEFGDATGTVGQASWNGSSTTQTSVNGTLSLTLSRTTPGIYPTSVTLCDMLNNCDTYAPTDLDSAGFQSSSIIFTNVVTITCPTEAISVMEDVEFDCTLTVSSNPLPVVSYNVYATLFTASGVVLTTVYPDDGSFDDPDAQSQQISIDITFHLAQYAANGTYMVTAEASGPNYMYDNAKTTFTVKAEINDLSPPALKAVNAPSITLPASSTSSIVVNLDLTDDAVGVKSAEVDIPGFGSGTWTSSNTAIGSDRSVSISVPITPMYTTLVRRLYYMRFTLCDKTDKCMTWASTDLSAAGFQSTFNVGPVDPNGSQGTLSCGGPYDVANGPVVVTCTYDVTFVTGIYTYTVFASRDGPDDDDEPLWSVQTTPGYYEDSTGNNITQTSTQKFTLPQYAPYGNYTVLGTAYDDALVNSLATTTKVVVLHTTNDMAPPTLRTLNVPVPPNMDINQFKARVSANDDASGVQSIQVYLYSKGTTGVGMVNVTSVNNRVVTNVEIPIVMNIYNASDSVFFVVEVMLVDVLGNKRYYSTLDLAADGFQANVTVLPSPSSTTTTGSTTDAGFALSASMHTLAVAFVFLLLANLYFA